MNDNNIGDKIRDLLSGIEQKEGVRILYACESGSRAWGFASSDSDYDVRFIYIHPPNRYLSIDEARNVIERPVEGAMDLSGWEIKKALKLFRKSNPPLLEWLQSPIIYLEKYSVARRLRKLLPEFYSPISCLYHYLHMAQGNFREYLKGEEVWLKKYFYMLRPILACKWIESDLGPVPMEFELLVNRVIKSKDLKSAIDKLLKQKRRGEELSFGPKIPVINDFIGSELGRLESEKFDQRKPKPNSEKLNDLFRSSLKEIWVEDKGAISDLEPLDDLT